MEEYKKLDLLGDYHTLLQTAMKNKHTNNGKYWLVYGYYRLGMLEQGWEYSLQVEPLLKETPLYPLLLIEQGKIKGGMGETDRALEILQKARNLLGEDDIASLSLAMMNMGHMYRAQGEYQKALECYDKSHVSLKNENYPKERAFALHNLGVIYRDRGEFQKALESCLQALVYFEDIANPTFLAASYNLLGDIYSNIGDYDKSIEFYTESHHLQKENSNPESLVLVLSDLAITHIIRGDAEEAEVHLKELDKLSEESTNKVIKLYQDYTRAILLKHRPRTADKVEAQKMLEILVRINDFRFEVLIDSLYHLIELLLIEYSMFTEKVVLNEIETYTSQLYTIAKNNKIYPSIFDTLILKSKLKITSKSYPEAIALVEEAIEVAKHHNLTSQILRGEIERNNIIDNLKDLKAMFSKSSVPEIIQNTEIIEYIQLIQKHRKSFG